jgi:DNA-binding PadR family transcriptional regulator
VFIEPYKVRLTVSGEFPGEFEQMLMLIIMQLGDEAYGARIREQLAEDVGREPSEGALYTTLKRLESKGYVSAQLESAGEERGGRPRRYYRPTRAGLATLRRSREALLRLWGPVEAQLDEA